MWIGIRKSEILRTSYWQVPLKCGADVHCRNSIAETPLHIAAKAENYSESVVKLLLDRGAHLDVPDERRIRDGSDSLVDYSTGL